MTAIENDRDLVEGARKGDPATWTSLYRAHHPSVYRYVRSRVRDEQQAEDLSAEVFLQALAGIRGFSGNRPLLAWLFGIARHVVASHYRSERRRSFFARLWRGDADEVQVDVADPSADADHQAELLDLQLAVRALTATQRELIRLRYLVGLSTAEIAVAMHKEPAAVYSLQARALIRLRDELEEKFSPASDEFRRSFATSMVNGVRGASDGRSRA